MNAKISEEIRAEQIHGLQKWHGGDPAQDRHSLEQWLRFAAEHMKRAEMNTPMDARQHLVKAAGLLVSAIQEFDQHGGWKELR